jgi:hypothetical protein
VVQWTVLSASGSVSGDVGIGFWEGEEEEEGVVEGCTSLSRDPAGFAVGGIIPCGGYISSNPGVGRSKGWYVLH